MISCSREEARSETAALVQSAREDYGEPIPTALLPSILRKKPLLYVDHPNFLISPIPETILLRVTAGLYYDVLSGGQDVINDANERFEQYCAELIAATMKQLEVGRAYRYGQKGAQFDTPDILIRNQGKLTIIAECKATKLTYLAQFAENPFEAARQQYSQLAKGVFQLWRFFSHVRRGIAKIELATECHAVLFTLDSFMQMAREPQDRVFAEANILADEDGNVAQEDRRPIIICAIHDLEFILTRATEASLLATLKKSATSKYRGWMLREVHRDTGAAADFGNPKPYPFDLENVLPWWNRIDKLEKQRNTN